MCVVSNHKTNNERAFQVNAKDMQILAQHEVSLQRRLDRGNAQVNLGGSLLSDLNIHYEMGDRTRAITCGGIGAMHKMVTRLGLPQAINGALRVFKVHLPYHESDHVLNIAYNVLNGGQCLEDIELLRQDEVYLDALGTPRIPDPTTAGDFTRSFRSERTILDLQDAINATRRKVWKKQPRASRRQAILDVDGTIAPTEGECKQGMGLSYKGDWGYHPLLVSLANTREPLYLVNRPGNVPSHADAPEWIDRALDLVDDAFDTVLLRGDTDFSLTKHLDR